VTAAIKVIIAGGDESARRLLGLVFDSESDFSVVGEARTAADIARLAEEQAADIVLVDLDSACPGTAAALRVIGTLGLSVKFVGVRGRGEGDPLLSSLMHIALSKHSPLDGLPAHVRLLASQRGTGGDSLATAQSDSAETPAHDELSVNPVVATQPAESAGGLPARPVELEAAAATPVRKRIARLRRPRKRGARSYLKAGWAARTAKGAREEARPWPERWCEPQATTLQAGVPDSGARPAATTTLDNWAEQPDVRGRPGKRWIVVAGWLALLIAAVNYWLPRAFAPDVSMYVAQPLLWLSLGGLAWWAWRREERRRAFPFSLWLIALAALIGFFQFGVVHLSGLVSGADYPTYTYSTSLVAFNAWFVITRLIGLELARRYLLMALSKYSAWLGPLVAWALLTTAALPLTSLLQITTYDDIVRSSVSTVLPAASEGVLSTYLCAIGGPLPAIAYRLVWHVFQWVWPLIPNLDWRLAALFSTAAPVFGMLVVSVLRSSRPTKAGTTAAGPQGRLSPLGRGELR
jgi:DNA-binding NarL/FixJ family response regulator